MAKTWADVKAGQTVELKGREWTVDKAKLKGKVVKVVVTGSAGSFSREMRAKDKVTIVKTAKVAQAPREERWATQKEHDKTMRELDERAHRYTPPTMPKTAPSAAGWDEAEDKAERKVRDVLGGKLLAVEVDGTFLMPFVTPDTIAAHLLTFHGIRYDGATISEVKHLAATHTAEEAVKVVDWEKLKAVHDAEHVKIADGKTEALVPHIHTKDRPAS